MAFAGVLGALLGLRAPPLTTIFVLGFRAFTRRALAHTTSSVLLAPEHFSTLRIAKCDARKVASESEYGA